MGKTSHDDLMVASFWLTMTQSARSHAAVVAQRCGGAFAELILRETSKFCEQEPPKSYGELSARTLQTLSLTAKISGDSHAAGAARQHPNVQRDILNETKAFSDRVTLNDDVAIESLTLMQKISNICFADRVDR